jgi:polyisoprenoid-binding protein YceI
MCRFKRMKMRLMMKLVLPLVLLAGTGTVGGTAAQETTRWTVAPQQNEARYRVREQLARLNFPNDAVGVTRGVGGVLVIDAEGRVASAESRFVIDMTALESDSDRRDNFVRRNTLQTDEHPTVVFVPTGLRGLAWPLPEAGAVTFQMVGELTIRGVTRPAVWDVEANVANGGISGEATTRFTFADFDITKPRVASVLSVDDDIRLEYSFLLVPQR